METNEETRTYGSEGHLVKVPSGNPNPSLRSPGKRVKSSKSSISLQRGSLIPQKDSVFSEGPSVEIVDKKKSDSSKRCECGPDLYSRVLGPTADETILTGLQTLIDLCGKLRVCGEKDDSGDEEPGREQDLPEKDTFTPVKTSKSQTERNVTVSKSQTDQNLKTSKSQTDRSVVSAGFQVNPSVKSAEAQTAGYPQMVSEILQTIGLSPEMVSKVMQTSFVDLTEPKKASLTSIFMETSNPSIQSNFMQTSIASIKSNAMQTTEPDLRSGQVQTSAIQLPTIQEQAEPPPPTPKSSIEIAEPKAEPMRTFATEHSFYLKGDEHKCISPPEPPELCKCCKCTSSQSMRRSSKESKSSSDKPACICNSKLELKCKCEPSTEKKRPGDDGERGDQQSPIEVKYAVTKISKYKEFTTFEVMRSTKNKPRQLPKGIEGVFVLKKKNGDSQGEVRVKTSKRGINGVKNGGSRTSNGKHKNSREFNGIKNGEERSRSKVEGN